MTRQRSWLCVFLFSSLPIITAGCEAQTPVPQIPLPPSVLIKQSGMNSLHEDLAAKITAADTGIMTKPGLVGAMGGAHVKLLRDGKHQVMLPLPQRTAGQVPICYFIRSTPPEATIGYRIHQREQLNHVISVELQGSSDQEVRLEWSSVVLIGPEPVSTAAADAESYQSASACVQSDSSQIKELAERLWPKSGSTADYARNIQQFIREMKPVTQPRSLDALGTLDSGMNGICTGNANIAVALLRNKGIGCRSLAVIPPTSQRLEMHRIVEYREENEWRYFDPSSLHTDIPMQPWQTLIMARTTVADEDIAMQPRMGAMIGCPYAQELELLSAGVTLWGQDFFWTVAKPLVEFEPGDEAMSLAISAWDGYLQEGLLSEGQISAIAAGDSRELTDSLTTP